MIIIKTSITRPPRMVIYGQHGVGKSTFAAKCPTPIFIQTEDGLDALGVDAFEKAKSLKDVHDALDYLLAEAHTYKTLVIDSLDWLEKLIFVEVCRETGVPDIAAIPYGRGYVKAEMHWKDILDKVNELNFKKKMLVCLLAHNQIKTFQDPERDNYDRYQLDLQNKAAALVCEFADIIGFATFKTSTNAKDGGFGQTVVKAKSTSERVLNLEERAAYTAKNRYGLPAAIAFEWSAIAELLKGAKKKEGNLTSTIEDKTANLKQVADEQKEKRAKKVANEGMINLPSQS